jgi:hypothetical protein
VGKPTSLNAQRTRVNNIRRNVRALEAQRDFNNAEWTRTNKLRWIPPTLENPIEPGIARDDTRPGTGIVAAKISLGSSNLTVPRSAIEPTPAGANDPILYGQQDYLAVGATHFVLGTRTGILKIEYGRNVHVRGVDLGAQVFQMSGQTKSGYAEGLRVDGYLGDVFQTEADAFRVGGAYNADSSVWSRPDLYLQNSVARRLHGTDRSHYYNVSSGIYQQDNLTGAVDNKAAISQIVVSAGVMTVTLAAALPSGAPVSGRQVIIGATSFNGDASPLINFNTTWAVGTVTSNTVFSLTNTKSRPVPPDGTYTNVGGFLWHIGPTNVLGQHSDSLQDLNVFYSKSFRIDKFTGESNYQAGGLVGKNGSNAYISRSNTRHWYGSDPQEYNSLGWLFETTLGQNQMYECYHRMRPGFNIEETGINGQINTLAFINGVRSCGFLNWPYYNGVFYQSEPAGGDFCVYDTSLTPSAYMTAYVSPGYGDKPIPAPGDITNITIATSSAPTTPVTTTSISEDTASGAVIAWASGVYAPAVLSDGLAASIMPGDVITKLAGEIVDIYVAGGDTKRFAMAGRALVRGPTGFDYNTATSHSVLLRAVCRSNPAITFDKSFTISITDNGLPSSVAAGSYVAQTNATSSATSQNASTTPYSFPGLNHVSGSQNNSVDRFLIIPVTSSAATAGRSFTSLTMTGSKNGSPVVLTSTAANLIRSAIYAQADGNTSFVQFIGFVIPANTFDTNTADFSVKWSSTMTRCGIAVYSATGISGISPYDSSVVTGAAATDLATSVSTNTNGLVIACAMYTVSGGGTQMAVASKLITAGGDGFAVAVASGAQATNAAWTGLTRDNEVQTRNSGGGGNAMVVLAFKPQG